MLFAGGGITLVTNNDAAIYYWAKRAGFDYTALEPAFEIPDLNTTLYAAFSLKTPVELVTRFSTALEQLKSDGTVDAIWEKWRSNPLDQ